MASAGGGLLPPGPRSSDLEQAPSAHAWESVPISNSGAPLQSILNVAGAPPERPSRRKRLLFWGGVAAAVVVVLAAVIALGASGGSRGGGQEEEDAAAAAQGAYAVRFLAVGDWGRNGTHNQTDVARLMGQVAEERPIDFVVSTGDNFYDHGLSSPNDPAFQKSFSQIYTADSLQVPWHAVLGNHDHCDSAKNCTDPGGCPFSPLHQLNITLQNADPRWHCERSYDMSLAGGRVQLFLLDTSPFIQRYRNESWIHCPGGIAEQSWQEQLLEFEHRLNASTAEWKIAVGHHPSHSNGEHRSNPDVIEHLEPLFFRYGVQAYFCGHDHNLEHLLVPSPADARQTYSVIVTGAGSKTGRQQNGTEFSHWFWPHNGFVGVDVTPELLTVQFYTLTGQPGGLTPTHTTQILRSGALGNDSS